MDLYSELFSYFFDGQKAPLPLAKLAAFHTLLVDINPSDHFPARGIEKFLKGRDAIGALASQGTSVTAQSLYQGLCVFREAVGVRTDHRSRQEQKSSAKAVFSIRNPRKVNSFIFFCDIVGFSKLNVQSQLLTVKRLYEALSACPSLSDLAATRYLQIPTGDGCAIVFMEPCDPLAPLRLACELHGVLRKKPSFEVRIGIHCGTNYLIRTGSGAKNIIGANMNVAARVMDQALPWQILSSKEYFSLYVQKESQIEHLAYDAGERVVKHGWKIHVITYYDKRRRIGMLSARAPKA